MGLLAGIILLHYVRVREQLGPRFSSGLFFLHRFLLVALGLIIGTELPAGHWGILGVLVFLSVCTGLLDIRRSKGA